MRRALEILVLGAAAAWVFGCDDGEPADCDETGCDAGFFCSPDTDVCEPDCTQTACEGDLVCNPQSRGCQQSCASTGCLEGSHCNPSSGLCDTDCTEGSCGGEQLCNPDTRACEDRLAFEDPSLEACVRSDVGLEAWPVLPSAVAGVTHLECPDMGITSIAGLEHFTALVDLTLWENQIADISPLAGLANLEHLQLGNNGIADLTPLSGLTRLTRLGLSDNQIVDLTPLAGLSALAWLNLDNNLIDNIAPLGGLGALTWLTLEGNVIGDTSRLAELQANGVDVYSRGARARANPIRELGPARGGGIPRARTDASAMSGAIPNFTTDERGVVTFELLVGDEVYEAHQLFDGEIVFDGARFLYRLGDAELQIGEVIGRDLWLCSGEYEQVCDFSFGRHLPGSPEALAPSLRGAPLVPVFTVSLTMRPARMIFDPPTDENYAYGTYHGLLDPFVLASPNQQDAGSCLLMAGTGAMEILLNQHTPQEQIAYQGPTDLSERFLMNAPDHVPGGVMPYYFTDVLYTYNHFGGSLLNSEYPFTAGYVRETSRGYVPADEDDDGAVFSCQYNWFDDLPEGWEEMLTETPRAERTIISLDPDLGDDSIWAVGLMTGDVVERIKYELRTKRAPVIVIYNHFLYWHTNIIVGYDDARPSGDCPMVRQSLEYFEGEGATAYVRRIESHMEEQGGCYEQGVFYVRDSIYDGTTEELMYDYSDVYNFRERYSRRVIDLEYDWVRYLANHVYTVHRR